MKRLTSPVQRREGVAGNSPSSQTLVRGLDVLEMVATGPLPLPALANRLGLARSTAHRLATALLERRYLTLMPREGYVLGPKLLELGALAHEQTALLPVARGHMEKLAADSLDSVHLTICESGAALLLERVQGHRRLLPSLHIGERAARSRCVGGNALLIDQSESTWRSVFAQDCGTPGSAPVEAVFEAAALAIFIDAMRQAAARGYASDADSSGDPLRTVAAPIRDADGTIVAALGLSTAAQYLDEDGLAASGRAVRAVADAISADLGHRPPASAPNAGGPGTRPMRLGKKHPAEAKNADQEPLPPLEARAPRVHDLALNGSSRAVEADRGVAHEA